MITQTLTELAAALGAEIIGDATLEVRGPVVTDSRQVVDGALFVARLGEHADGHDHVEPARAAGAVAAVVEHPLDVDIAQLVVADSTRALGDLARHVLDVARAHGSLERVIGITGSAGKTTTKRILAHLLTSLGPTVFPEQSFNNEVGAPLSMLRTDLTTRFVIVEMGASHIGDLRYLSSVARPDIGVELQVGLAHVGEFGSVDNIRIAKQELIESLPASGTAVLNADDPQVRAMAEHTSAAITWFGQHPTADVRILDVRPTAAGVDVRLGVGDSELTAPVRLLGEHNAYNIAAATAVALTVGMTSQAIAEGLQSLTGGERWRMQALRRDDDVTIINDAYNASPGSMHAALRTLADLGRAGHRTFAVLGAMSELGAVSADEHDKVGRDVVRLNIDQLVVVGAEARQIFLAAEQEGSWGGEAVYCENADEALAWLEPRLRAGDIALVKSSNASGLRFLGDRLAAGEVSE